MGVVQLQDLRGLIEGGLQAGVVAHLVREHRCKRACLFAGVAQRLLHALGEPLTVGALPTLPMRLQARAALQCAPAVARHHDDPVAHHMLSGPACAGQAQHRLHAGHGQCCRRVEGEQRRAQSRRTFDDGKALAGQAHVDAIDEASAHDLRPVRRLHRLPDRAAELRAQHRLAGQRQAASLLRQRAEVQLPAAGGVAHDMIGGITLRRRHAPARGRRLHQRHAHGRCSRAPDAPGADHAGGAPGDDVARLARRQQADVATRQIGTQFGTQQLRDRGRGALADVGLGLPELQRAVGPQAQPAVGLPGLGRVADLHGA